MIEELAEWLKLKLDVPVFVSEIPKNQTAFHVIQLERSPGGPARGATKTEGAAVWVYGESLSDAEALYARAEGLLLGDTRMPGIISVNHESGPTQNVDNERRRPHVLATWSVIVPRVRLAGARG